MPEDTKSIVTEESTLPSVERPSVATAAGGAIFSAIGRTPSKDLVTVIGLYSKNSGWGRGAEIFNAPDETAARTLMSLLAAAELEDWTALGLQGSIEAGPDGSFAVVDPSGKIEPSRFLLGTPMTSVALSMRPADVPDPLKPLLSFNAVAGAPAGNGAGDGPAADTDEADAPPWDTDPNDQADMA